MKYLVDAQLPKSLLIIIRELGFDCIHTLDLPQGNLTSDIEISRYATQNKYVVINGQPEY